MLWVQADSPISDERHCWNIQGKFESKLYVYGEPILTDKEFVKVTVLAFSCNRAIFFDFQSALSYRELQKQLLAKILSYFQLALFLTYPKTRELWARDIRCIL